MSGGKGEEQQGEGYREEEVQRLNHHTMKDFQPKNRFIFQAKQE